MRFQGSLVAIVTPMKEGAVDLRALRELVEWQLAEGTDGIVPCGTTGEGVTLTAQERVGGHPHGGRDGARARRRHRRRRLERHPRVHRRR